MMSTKRGEALDLPRRVEILRVEDQRPSSYFKVGQFGWAHALVTSGGFATQDAGESKAGQVVYAVSKAKDGRSGAVWFTEDGIRFTERGSAGKRHATKKKRASQRKGTVGKPRVEVDRRVLAVWKRGVRRIYEVLWYANGVGEVRSLVNGTVIAEYTPGLGWEDQGRLPDDIREYAQQLASSGGSHPETSGRSAPQPEKSHAQIKREVDEILAGGLGGPSRASMLLNPVQRAYVAAVEEDVQRYPSAYKAYVRADPAKWAIRHIEGLDDAEVREMTREQRAETKHTARRVGR